jgi:adenylylsulfate kinase
VLDGDNLRHGLSSDLGFSPDDRAENIRRVSEVAALFADAGALCVTSFISPYRADRALARARVPADRFVEIYLDVPIEVCERRDPKGLYRKARRGELREFTGISAPYEVPEAPELRLDTSALDVDACVATIVAHLTERGFFTGA